MRKLIKEFSKIRITMALSKLLFAKHHHLYGLKDEDVMEAILNYKVQFERTLNTEGPISLMMQIYMIFDSLLSDATSKRTDIQCKKGCSFCCHINVDCNKIETDLIIYYANKNAIAINVEYLELQKDLSIDQRTMSKNSACVFLDKEGSCSIYMVRPMACRKYLVASDPKGCNAKEYPKGNIKIYAPIEIEILASALVNVDDTFGNMVHNLLTSLKE